MRILACVCDEFCRKNMRNTARAQPFVIYPSSERLTKRSDCFLVLRHAGMGSSAEPYHGVCCLLDRWCGMLGEGLTPAGDRYEYSTTTRTRIFLMSKKFVCLDRCVEQRDHPPREVINRILLAPRYHGIYHMVLLRCCCCCCARGV